MVLNRQLVPRARFLALSYLLSHFCSELSKLVIRALLLLTQWMNQNWANLKTNDHKEVLNSVSVLLALSKWSSSQIPEIRINFWTYQIGYTLKNFFTRLLPGGNYIWPYRFGNVSIPTGNNNNHYRLGGDYDRIGNILYCAVIINFTNAIIACYRLVINHYRNLALLLYLW